MFASQILSMKNLIVSFVRDCLYENHITQEYVSSALARQMDNYTENGLHCPPLKVVSSFMHPFCSHSKGKTNFIPFWKLSYFIIYKTLI